jgi:hypothetical protein
MATVCPEGFGALVEDFSSQAETLPTNSEADQLRPVLTLGVSLAFHIDYIDATWRKAVLGGIDEYDPAQEGQILGFHRAWLRGAEKIVPRLDRLEARNIKFEWSEPFRRLYREAKALMTPDDRFFGGDDLVGMRDDAIDSHRGGHTVEFHELGD